jgi:hypothetical protein
MLAHGHAANVTAVILVGIVAGAEHGFAPIAEVISVNTVGVFAYGRTAFVTFMVLVAVGAYGKN